MNLKIQRLLNKMSTISGRRKEATAVVRLTKGKGNLTVNKKNIDEYFGRDVAKMIIRQPLVLTNSENAYDIDIKVQGGGSFGQAGAIRLAISKALIELNPELRADLKKAGYLTRDSRVKERKKVGLKKARKSPQFSKR
tara:strand:- start:585 stop:998 length:414 start_codon:yes stop_codon:yes gene_type:complete